MAVSDTWTAPADIAAGVSDRDFMNSQLADNMTVVQKVLLEGDASASGEVHRHKSGTLANRPAASDPGRLYFVTSGVAQGVQFIDNGTNWIPVGVQLLNRNLTQTEVVNSTSETSIYSYSIPADILGATGGVRLTLVGDYLNNSGASRTLVIKTKLGATTALTSNAATITVGANRLNWEYVVWFLNSSASAQKWGGQFMASARGSADELLLGASNAVVEPQGVGLATSAEDTSGALTLDVTATHNNAHASLSIRRETAALELLPALA